jgi:hypothetical protein
MMARQSLWLLFIKGMNFVLYFVKQFNVVHVKMQMTKSPDLLRDSQGKFLNLLKIVPHYLPLLNNALPFR